MQTDATDAWVRDVLMEPREAAESVLAGGLAAILGRAQSGNTDAGVTDPTIADISAECDRNGQLRAVSPICRLVPRVSSTRATHP